MAPSTTATTAAAEPPISSTTSTTLDPVARIEDAVAAALQPGRILYNPPETMTLEAVERIEVRITRSELVTDSSLASDLGGSGQPVIDQIPTAVLMAVRLSGPAFEVAPLSDEEQVVSGDFAQWEFDVTPQEAGPQTLSLSVSARVPIEGRDDVTQSLPVLDKRIEVEVGAAAGGWWSWARWVLLATVAVVAVAAARWFAPLRRWRAPAPAATPRRIQVFLSYRRDDVPGWAGRIYDRLGSRFGEDQVFMDVEDIDPGEDFVAAVRRRVAGCDAVVVMIGPGWLTATDEHGRRRLDDEADLVAAEVATALSAGPLVVPVLIEGAGMPSAAELPPHIRGLANRNALRIDADRFGPDTARLIGAIEQSAHRSVPTASG